MSGYLEVKSNLYLKPFKTWKRQWCILRPSPTRAGSGSLAVYSSEAGSVAGSIEFPPGSTVRRTKSRSRPYAFAVFSSQDLRKPIILLAANTDSEAQVWMRKIEALFAEENVYFGPDTLKDTYPITLINTDLSRICGFTSEDCLVSVSIKGIILEQSDNKHLSTLVPWKCIIDIDQTGAQGQEKDCNLYVNSTFEYGAGHVTLRHASPSLVAAILASRPRASRSEGDLRSVNHRSPQKGAIRSSSWYSGPSDVSLDDIDLAMSKEKQVIPVGQLCRSARAPHLAHDDSVCASDRRSLQSVSSGIYEEIPDPPHGVVLTRPPDLHTPTPHIDIESVSREEPAYESVSECRSGPPPLPPRVPLSSRPGESWSSALGDTSPNVTRHSSLGSLPRCCPQNDYTKNAKTLPSKSRQAFNAFRKRLKSDPKLNNTKTCDAKENKPSETKKKRFDFGTRASRDLFKNFRGKKSPKSPAGNLAKIGETKSCEFLDESLDHVGSNRCSKSVEFLDEDGFEDDDEVDEIDGEVEGSLSLPSDIVELILRGRERLAEVRIRHHQLLENDYIPMSVRPSARPSARPHQRSPTPEPHYLVMSPRARTDLATL